VTVIRLTDGARTKVFRMMASPRRSASPWRPAAGSPPVFRGRRLAAGGLAPENVKQAIQILRPWGVDVVSGVESAPGKKDPARVLAFIRSAQEAAEEILATEAK